MEKTLDSNINQSGLSVSPEMRYQLGKQAYWAKILGILGLIIYGLCSVMLLFGSAAVTTLMPNLPSSVVLIIPLGISILAMVLSYMCFDHGLKVKSALRNEDQELFEVGIEKFAKLIKIQGIFQIVFIFIYLVVVIFMLLYYKSNI